MSRERRRKVIKQAERTLETIRLNVPPTPEELALIHELERAIKERMDFYDSECTEERLPSGEIIYVESEYYAQFIESENIVGDVCRDIIEDFSEKFEKLQPAHTQPPKFVGGQGKCQNGDTEKRR